MAKSWVTDYERCPIWGVQWQAIQEGQHQSQWPQGFKLADGRMLKDNRWCIPTNLTGKVLRQHHEATGHMGGERLWKEANRHHQFADLDDAKAIAMRVQSQCEVCQACEHPHQPLRLKITSTPVPPDVMSSMAIDLFVMPEVIHEGQRWNVFAAAVDRHSGWCVATPHHTKGLTASKFAEGDVRQVVDDVRHPQLHQQ